jgi:hypothetical protein
MTGISEIRINSSVMCFDQDVFVKIYDQKIFCDDVTKSQWGNGRKVMMARTCSFPDYKWPRSSSKIFTRGAVPLQIRVCAFVLKPIL